MATTYSMIYNKFLSKITDLDLTGLSQNIAESTMLGYMDTAINNFTDCFQNLSDRNDDTATFNITLIGYEINIIAEGMLYEWVEPKINNLLVLKQYLSSSDFKGYSQANHLKELQSLRDSYEERMDRLMTRYSYKFGDFETMGLGDNS